MTNKGIIYYTDNRIGNPIRDTVRHFIKESGLPIVSCSLKPIHFGKNIVLTDRQRSYPTYLLQIYTALENLDTKNVFFCFQGNTHIETISGQKRIDRIRVGELVKTHLGRFKPVTKVFVRPYKQGLPLIQVDTQFSSIRCTPEHLYYVYKNGQKKWLPADKLQKDDILLYPSKYKEDHIDFNILLRSNTKSGGYGKLDVQINKLAVDQDLARFMGIYLAEGHFNGKNGIGFTFNNKEEEYQDFVQKVCYEKFGRKARKRVQWSTQILININQLGPLFKKWFGNNSVNKKIPEFVFSWNIKNKLSFIKGFLEGDGSRSINDDSFYSFNTASKKITEDMIILMNNSGIGWDNIVKERRQTKFGKNEYFDDKKVYSINHSRIVFRKLKDILNSNWVDKSYIGIPVRNVKQKKMARIPLPLSNNNIRSVYNLEVKDDNSYVAQSTIVHNCEHDVLYHPSHFDFTPPRDDIFYYNDNVWRWKLWNMRLVTYKRMRPLSCLCCNRELAIEHYKKRIKKAEELKLDIKRSREPRTAHIWGFEPGTKPVRRGGFSDDVCDDWYGAGPNIDIRHNKTFTSLKIDREYFKILPEGYKEITYQEMHDWDLKGLFGKGIKNHTSLDFDSV